MIHSEVIMNDLILLGIPKKLVNIINTMLIGFKAVVRVDSQVTSPFVITTSTKQGSPAFPHYLTNVKELNKLMS